MKLGQYLILRHGSKVVLFGRFVAFLRILAAFMAGANRQGLVDLEHALPGPLLNVICSINFMSEQGVTLSESHPQGSQIRNALQHMSQRTGHTS
jgi:hypothetical protein